eukprot:8755526-Heterocapsa_arctica.AAC.1
MDDFTLGSEGWRLPFGPHLMTGNGIPVQVWSTLSEHLGTNIIAAAHTHDALNTAADPAGGWDIGNLHVSEAAHGNIADISGQIIRAWHPRSAESGYESDESQSNAGSVMDSAPDPEPGPPTPDEHPEDAG